MSRRSLRARGGSRRLRDTCHWCRASAPPSSQDGQGRLLSRTQMVMRWSRGESRQRQSNTHDLMQGAYPQAWELVPLVGWGSWKAVAAPQFEGKAAPAGAGTPGRSLGTSALEARAP